MMISCDGEWLKAVHWPLSASHFNPYARPNAIEEDEHTYKDLMNRLAYHPGTMRMRALVPRLSGSADRMKTDTEIAHLRETAFRR